MRSRSCGLVLLILFSWGGLRADSKQAQDWAVRYQAWLCKVAGYGCKLTKRPGTTRGDVSPRLVGETLMTYDLEGPQGHPQGRFIWEDCNCWSPIPIGSESLAVVTEDGIWLVPLSHPAGRKLIFKNSDVLELLDAGGSPSSILFLQSSKDNDCAFQPYELNTETLKVSRAPASLNLECGSEWDAQNLKKPAQVAAGRTLSAAIYNGKYKIYLEIANESRPLLPAPGGANLDCFDPVWITHSVLAFVSGKQ